MDYVTTVMLDFKVKTIQVGDKRVKIQIYDTAGQERFRTMTRGYYANADGALLMYDVTDPLSFDHIQDWMAELQQRATDDYVVPYIVGNKIDKIKRVQTAQLKKLSQSFLTPSGAPKPCKYYETSVAENVGVDQVFEDLIGDMLRAANLKYSHKPSSSSFLHAKVPAISLTHKNVMTPESLAHTQSSSSCCRSF